MRPPAGLAMRYQRGSHPRMKRFVFEMGFVGMSSTKSPMLALFSGSWTVYLLVVCKNRVKVKTTR